MNEAATVEKSTLVVPERFSRPEERGQLPAVAGTTDVTALMAMITRVASDPDYPVEKLKELLAVKERWEATEARKAYNAAFALFKAEAIQVLKNKGVNDGPLKGKRYAELHSVVNAVTPALSRHGLSAAWKLTKDEKDWIEVTCSLTHSLGHVETVSMSGPPDAGGAKNAIQARASTITYLERYTLKAICGVAEEGQDDDGRGGKGKRLPEDDAAEHLKAIDSAPDGKALLKLYGDAHKAAIDAEDMGALRLFTQHKDARKKALES